MSRVCKVSVGVSSRIHLTLELDQETAALLKGYMQNNPNAVRPEDDPPELHALRANIFNALDDVVTR